MKREPFDRELEQVLREKGDPVRFSAAEEERVLSRVLDRVGEPGQEEDAEMMGRFTGRKILVAAAAICMGAAFVAVAGGKVVMVTSSVRTDQPTYRSAAEVTAETGLGFTPKAVDAFENGYELWQGYSFQMEGYDEDQQKVTESPSISVDYRKGDESVSLSIETPMAGLEAQDEVPDESQEYEGVTLNYSEFDSLFVDVDYVPTEEEQRLMDEGLLNIAYGLPDGEREEVTYQYVNWEEDGGRYSLMAREEAGLTADDLFQMAREVIDSGE